jgi:hypothetical protein
MIKTLSSASLRSSRTASAWGSRKQGTTRPGHGSDPARTTPAFSWISPNLCDDGHDASCVTGAPGGLAQAGCFLSQRVPKIMAAPAYQDCGLIVITFGEGSDSAYCGEASEFGPDDQTCRCPAFSTGVGLEMPTLAAPVGVLAAAVGMSRVVNGVHYPVRHRGGMDGRRGGRNADAALAAAPVSARGRVSRLTPAFRQDAAATLTLWATGS